MAGQWIPRSLRTSTPGRSLCGRCDGQRFYRVGTRTVRCQVCKGRGWIKDGTDYSGAGRK